jgi:FkbM family methyltransferase
MGLMTRVVRRVLRSRGYELRRVDEAPPEPGSDRRPVGDMEALLEDLRHRGLACATIVDVGANHTHWSRSAKRVFPDARCVLIEPQTELQAELEQFVRDFPGSMYELAGAGATKSVQTLTVWDDLAGSSFRPVQDDTLKANGRQRDVPIVTIDALLAERNVPCPELMKLDIQGYELEALRGAEGTFGRTEAYILEVSLLPFEDVPGAPLFLDVVNFMGARGYVVYDFPGFLRRPLDGALGQCDVCFVKAESMLRRDNRWRR